MKTCSKCQESKPENDFQKNKNRVDGLMGYCRECNNLRLRIAYAKNPAEKIARTRKYHLDNPEWSKSVLAEWHRKNRELRSERTKKRLKEDPQFLAYRKEVGARSERQRRAQKANTEFTKISADDYAKILEEYNNTCWICEQSLVSIHWDHVQPLSKGGAHIVSNLRPACPPCNVRKNDLFPFTDEMKERIANEVRNLSTSKEVML